MSYTWNSLSTPAWNEELESIVRGVPQGAFPVESWRTAQVLPGSWWIVRDAAGQAVACATMDTVWGDGEVMVLVDGAQARSGAGAFAMDQLRTEAQARGLSYLRGQVPAVHPETSGVIRWLTACGFSNGSSDGEYYCRVRAIRAAA